MPRLRPSVLAGDLLPGLCRIPACSSCQMKEWIFCTACCIGAVLFLFGLRVLFGPWDEEIHGPSIDSWCP